MINTYGLFYQYNTQDDYLIIFFDDAFGYIEERKKNVAILKKEDRVIGYKLYEFKNLVKIKSTGLIALPSDILIDVINDVLKVSKLETLSYKKNSGYVVKTIGNKQVVVATPGTALPSLTIVREEHVCTYKDLEITDEESVFELEEKEKEESDFFHMEAK